MTRLSSSKREQLYNAEAEKARELGRGELPICKLCDLPITPGQDWDVNHESHKPRWLGGNVDGLSHRRCNRRHNNKHDTPLFAKGNRVRQKFIGAFRSRQPMQGGRDDRMMKRMDGTVVDRTTGEPWQGGARR